MQATRDRLQLYAKQGSGAGDLSLVHLCVDDDNARCLTLPEFRKREIPSQNAMVACKAAKEAFWPTRMHRKISQEPYPGLFVTLTKFRSRSRTSTG
jgi:hypothetical protein